MRVRAVGGSRRSRGKHDDVDRVDLGKMGSLSYRVHSERESIDREGFVNKNHRCFYVITAQMVACASQAKDETPYHFQNLVEGLP